MIKKDNKVSSLQIMLMGSMIGNGLFVGLGNIETVFVARQDTWIVALVSLIVGILPAFLIYKIIDYLPDLTLLEKTKKLLSKVGGHFINFILLISALVFFLLTTWTVGNFAATKYLTETPIIFIFILFMIPTIYANLKGIETIVRTTQILFFISLVIHFVITFALLKYSDVENIKPILNNGIEPILRGVAGFISYALAPFILLLIIPKNQIVDNQKLKKHFLIGYILAAFFMLVVFYMNMSIAGINLVYLYRFPEYYLIKKVSIGNIFDNIENFLSIHWIFNVFSLMMLSLYFIKEYFISTFKIKKNKTKTIIIVLIGLVSSYLAYVIPPNTTFVNNFIRNYFPPYFGLTILILVITINIVILIRKKFTKKFNN